MLQLKLLIFNFTHKSLDILSLIKIFVYDLDLGVHFSFKNNFLK